MRNRQERLSVILKDKAFTGFERAVYRAVAAIPAGEVRSYKWVARRIGRPRAARAVGNALNKNRHPGLIPCHRVVMSDGSMGGYSKGPSAKRRILRSEGIDLEARY
jgi:O-6-methylguanine DNA methyltransferase